MTRPETLLWAILRRRQQGLYFRRQRPIWPYVLDFYCSSAKLCVEVDGPGHSDQDGYDGRRSAWLLAKEGIRVLRFSAEEIEMRPAAVLAAIAQAAPPSTSLRLVLLPRKRERSPD